MHDLRRMGATNALIERRRTPIAARDDAAHGGNLRRALRRSDGRIRATFDIVWLSGWAPHESQQKPLRPGSAKTRLADRR